MRDIKERLEVMKQTYEMDEFTLFDVETILKLEEEYIELSEKSPNFVKQRNELLRMRNDLRRSLTLKRKFNTQTINKIEFKLPKDLRREDIEEAISQLNRRKMLPQYNR